eukprot:CAMPEP_0177614748 /NCGR_PEP_ID=MMETSP0419_2-20121207/22933_1 /TAXON_ID=582737 /ORGANISM="Tetraselmis sp., Strain GSL018" /LENGTH=1707 /DNA_ID=CAMNT_0019112051 /DNA_START=174 /DNA_END=5298 /DNA_ORIENTATION=-
MQLRHWKTVLAPVEGISKVTALCWSANNKKFAAVTTDRVVYLFNENGERKDKFKTKPADANAPPTYVVRGMCFSPDSTKLVIAQSDNIVFVYRLGLDWHDKKSICNKFHQNSPITQVVWPVTRPNEILFGVAEGKVKVGQTTNNKAYTLYAHPEQSYVVSLAANLDGTSIVSGHLDCSLYCFTFDAGGGSGAHSRFAQHSCVPYALAWGESLCAAGSDSKIVFYEDDGSVLQTFDHSHNEDIREFTTAQFNPSGETVVVGSFNRFHIYCFNSRSRIWEEVGAKEIENFYTVTSLSWRPDGSRLAVGSLCGGVDLYDACLRKQRYKGKFEFTYVSKSQVIVQRLATNSRIVLKSSLGYEIERINIQQDRFLIAHTPHTLLMGDLETCKLSEVPWSGSGSEKFIFDSPQVCMIYNAGELTLIEYGRSEVLGTCRTEHMSPYLISVRLNEQRGIVEENKKIAYLIDLQTIRILDLMAGLTLATINHDARIDWLELNARATHLLFRDKKKNLHLYNIKAQERITLLTYCSYVQWVPNSDVVVAQNRSNLCVWYTVDEPDNQTVFPIKGEVTDIERSRGKTEVIVDEGINTVSYALDESLIEFGTACEEQDWPRAVEILEPLELTPETEAKWHELSDKALEVNNLQIAEQCFAAVGDVAKARYLHMLNDIAAKHAMETGGDGADSYEVQARLAILRKRWRDAENIYISQGRVDEAIAMYTEAHRWSDAIRVAERNNHSEAETLKHNYYQWLLETGQEEEAAAVKEKEGDALGAISLYLKGGLPAKAAHVVISNPSSYDPAMLDSISSALQRAGMSERAGEFFEHQRRYREALEAYRNGHAYRRAVDLARREFPGEVIQLEEEWGDWLMASKQVDAAINHFIEAGKNVKAIEAALECRQWAKAAGIIDNQDRNTALPFYKRIARHYDEARQWEEAERYYIKAGLASDAVEMYVRAGKWEAAHKVAMGYLTDSEVHVLYTKRARELEAQHKFKEAEKMYLTVKEHDLAINMYKKNRMYDQMIRLVSLYRKDLLAETHLHLAQQLENEGHFKEAEKHYTDAKDWKSAVQMYRANDMWDDALRVAKLFGGVNGGKQVAYAWAVSLGGEEGAALLSKFGLVDQAIEYAIESGAFAHAFELTRASAKHKLPEVHEKYAMFLEDEGRYKEAEEEFVKANKPGEAIAMYIHLQDWDAAMRVAETSEPSSIGNILVAQGQKAAERRDYATAEMQFLRAKRPDEVLAMYKKARMWEEALRIAEDYLPTKVNEIHSEIASSVGKGRGASSVDGILQRAKMLERSKDWGQAIDAYLEVDPSMSSMDAAQSAWEAAVRVAQEHLPHRSHAVVSAVSERLAEGGRVGAAAEMHEDVGDFGGAVRLYLRGGMVDRARATAAGNSRLEELVEAHAQQSAPAAGAAGGRAAAGESEAIEAHASAGEWDKVHELAAREGAEVVAHYTLRHAKMKAQQGDFAAAASVLAKYGVKPDPGNFDLQKLVEQMEATPDVNAPALEGFRGLFLAAHLSSQREVCAKQGWQTMAAKCATSLLRHVGSVPADKAFYQAGAAWRAVGRLNMAFVFLNRYLDITEAMEDPEGFTIENSDFVNTDIPAEFDLPERHYLDEDKREEVREWVLALSMDQDVEQSLSCRTCSQCGADTYEANLVCHSCKVPSEACCITGYPIPSGERVACKADPSVVARKDDWNTFIGRLQMCPITHTVQSPVY